MGASVGKRSRWGGRDGKFKSQTKKKSIHKASLVVTAIYAHGMEGLNMRG